jgi:hypothetical protein
LRRLAYYRLQITDYKLLAHVSLFGNVHNIRVLNSKLKRWAMKLQEFDFTVQSIKGASNVESVADYLSRAYMWCIPFSGSGVLRNGSRG